MRRTLWHLSQVYLFSIKSYWQKCTVTLWRHKVTSDDLSGGKWCNSAPEVPSIAYLVMLLDDLSRSDAYQRYLIFSPLTYNGEVTKLTWPKVTDIKNLKYTNCRYPWSYCTLWVSKSSDHCTMGPQPDLARHQRLRRLVANGVKCISNYSELSTYQIVFRYHVQSV